LPREGNKDAAFRTKPQIALKLVEREADSFYGENDTFVSNLAQRVTLPTASGGAPEVGYALSGWVWGEVNIQILTLSGAEPTRESGSFSLLEALLR
jgi:hypothetical protein